MNVSLRLAFLQDYRSKDKILVFEILLVYIMLYSSKQTILNYVPMRSKTYNRVVYLWCLTIVAGSSSSSSLSTSSSGIKRL